MVVHMTRREGRRYVEDAISVDGYSLAKKRFLWKPIPFKLVSGRSGSGGNR